MQGAGTARTTGTGDDNTSVSTFRGRRRSLGRPTTRRQPGEISSRSVATNDQQQLTPVRGTPDAVHVPPSPAARSRVAPPRQVAGGPPRMERTVAGGPGGR